MEVNEYCLSCTVHRKVADQVSLKIKATTEEGAINIAKKFLAVYPKPVPSKLSSVVTYAYINERVLTESPDISSIIVTEGPVG